MSIKTVARVIDRGVSASQLSARLVLIMIANYADDRGFGYAKTKTVADGANIDRSTAWRKVEELIELGEVRCFTRGHYEAPAYVITIVEHPLTTEEITTRLYDLDRQAHWVERMPGTQGLPFERSLQDATISEKDGDPFDFEGSQASDQGFQGGEARENTESELEKEIVANRNDRSRIATNPSGEIVANRDGSLRSRDVVQNLKKNSSTTTTTTGLPIVAERDDLGGGGNPPDLNVVRLVGRWCELTGKNPTGRLLAGYIRQVQRFLENHPEPDDAFLQRAAAEGIKHPSGWAWINGAHPVHPTDLPDCQRCDNRRMLGQLDDGSVVDLDHPDADTAILCPDCRQPAGERFG